MKIHFKRSGGFMGRPLQASLDTAALPEDEARTLHTMLSDAAFFDLPESHAPAAPPAGADQMTYTVTVQADHKAHTVCVSDMDAPEGLRPLLRHLTVLARRPGPGDQPADEV